MHMSEDNCLAHQTEKNMDPFIVNTIYLLKCNFKTKYSKTKQKIVY